MALTPSLVVYTFEHVFVQAMATGRVMYLVYELTFICMAFTYGAIVLLPRLASVDDKIARWLKWVLGFQLCGYVGWALCDLIILSGYDVGHALRILPNAMYYAGFIPIVYFTVPNKERSWLEA